MAVAQERATGPAALQRRGRFRPGDALLYVVTCAAALTGVVLLALITKEVLTDAWPAMQKFGLGFLTTQAWGDKHNTLFGAKSFIFGTIVTSFGALLIATPLSLAIALFLTELAPRWIKTIVAPLIDLLAAIPSVVLGLWGILVFGPWVRDHLEPWLQEVFGFLPIFSGEPSQAGLLPAALVLTIMIVPICSSICRELFLSVPVELEEGAMALGATRWEMVRGVVLPYTRSGVSAALILGLGRAVGEAIAVSMVLGAGFGIHWSLFATGDTLASKIANQYQSADTDILRSSLVYLAGILLIISLVVNLAAQVIVRRFSHQRVGGT